MTNEFQTPFIKQQKDVNPSICSNAIGGLFPLLVANGQPIDSTVKNRAPRTALGITNGGAIVLYATSNRITAAELAKKMARFGVAWAVNSDGGGSVGLYRQGNTAPLLSPMDRWRYWTNPTAIVLLNKP